MTDPEQITVMDEPSGETLTTPSDAHASGLSRGTRAAVLIGALAFLGGAGFILWQALLAKSTTQTIASIAHTPNAAPLTFAEGDTAATLPVPDAGLIVPVDTTEQPVTIRPADALSVPNEAPRRDDALVQDAQTLERIDAVRADIARVRDELTPLESALTQLQARVVKLEQSTEVQATYEDVIASLRSDIDALDRKVEDLKKKPPRQRTSRARATPKHPPTPTLPFRAEAIDWWGAQPSLVVRTDSQRHFLTPGQTLAGWRLSAVDHPGQSAVFERDGQRVHLAVSP